MGDVLSGPSRHDGRTIHLVTTAGAGVGRGHLARSLTLAETLAGHGLRVSLELEAGHLDGETAARAARIGIALGRDPSTTAVVVVDLPDIAEAAARHAADRLVVFDDRDAFAGRAAVVVQPSMPTWAGTGRAGRVLAGFEYAPVARVFVERRGRPTPQGSGTPELLVCFGGSDPALVTQRVAGALAGTGAWQTTTVVGADYAGRLDALPPGVVRDPADLPARLARADLVVSGAGTMKFEVACLGRPAVLLAVADDQLAVGPPFAATGAAGYLGDGRTIDPGEVLAAVASLMADGTRRAAMGRLAATVVDGGGAERLAAAILALAGPPEA